MEALSWIRSPAGEVCAQGAHVTRWREGLFLSSKSRFEAGQAIRGGVPVIFTWFGDDPEGRGRPAHGFARRVDWRVVEQATTKGELRAVFELEDDEHTRAQGPGRFRLRLAVHLGAALELELRTENRGPEPLRCENALHTYLAVGDVHQVRLHGLTGAEYADKVAGGARGRQGAEPLSFHGEFDRVFRSEATCRLEDFALGRTLVVEKSGSRSTIVWNPWSTKAARLSDLGDGEWTRFLCVESGNVGPEALQLAPGAAHVLGVRITIS